jgi:hypothetical protein
VLKGAFVCAYVGERVSEEDLQLQEEHKLAALTHTLSQSRSFSSSSSSASSSPSSPASAASATAASASATAAAEGEREGKGGGEEEGEVMTGYVTYAFQIHDGTDVVNIDSE